MPPNDYMIPWDSVMIPSRLIVVGIMSSFGGVNYKWIRSSVVAVVPPTPYYIHKYYKEFRNYGKLLVNINLEILSIVKSTILFYCEYIICYF